MDWKTYQYVHGLGSYRTTLFTAIPTTPQAQIPMPKEMPNNIGRIWGLAIYADTVTPSGETLITTTESQNLYMTFKDAATEFYPNVRLDDLLFNFAGVPATSGQRWMPVNLPGQFDLSNSFFLNPTLIVSPAVGPPKVIALTFYFISRMSYRKMLNAGMVLDEMKSYKDKFPESSTA